MCAGVLGVIKDDEDMSAAVFGSKSEVLTAASYVVPDVNPNFLSLVRAGAGVLLPTGVQGGGGRNRVGSLWP